jgi:hypothetical protein
MKHGSHNNINEFKQKFWLSLLFTFPTLVFSQTVQGWLGIHWTFGGNELVPAIFGMAIYFYGGLVFIKGAKVELKNRSPGMMTLISMAITVAFVYSLAVTLGFVVGMDFWWELATLVTIMLLGHWLEMASVQNAQGALSELSKLLPDEAELVHLPTSPGHPNSPLPLAASTDPLRAHYDHSSLATRSAESPLHWQKELDASRDFFPNKLPVPNSINSERKLRKLTRHNRSYVEEAFGVFARELVDLGGEIIWEEVSGKGWRKR